MTTDDLMPVIAAHRRAFGDLLDGLSAADWDAPTLCSGWRVREVVAHMTMPFRLSTPQFLRRDGPLPRQLRADGRPGRPEGRPGAESTRCSTAGAPTRTTRGSLRAAA